jgi:hypothetical protein
MLYLIPLLCAVVCTFFAAQFFAAKTRSVEKAIDEAILKKLAASPMAVELDRLKEENGVMRNLLIDMVENETSVPAPATHPTSSETARAMNTRTLRRREIFGEAVYLLRQTEKPRRLGENSKIDG